MIGLINTFIRHPNAANLLMALLIILGLASLARINTQFFPPVDRPTISISIAWPGASAEDVEANILAIVEPEVRFIAGVDEINSYAREGSGSISLEFEEGANMQEALSDVETAVKGVTNLPEDSEEPVVSRSQFFDSVAKIAISGPVPEETLRTWAKRMRDDLIARGIDKIDMTGLRERELKVEIPERDLRRVDLGIAEISNTIARNGRDLPSGNVEGGTEKQLRVLADVSTPSALAGVEVKSFATGEKVFLGDIATVENGYEDGSVQGFTGGEKAIEIWVRRAETADTLATAQILYDYVEEIEPQLPANMTLMRYEAAADSLAERIGLLVNNGLSGLILVIATLFLFLNFRIAFWVAIGIPVAMLATVGIMFLLGQTINMISLFALIMMLGVIVDDAIVVGEHTDTRLSMGDDAVTAAERGVGTMFMPIMAAMTTTIAAFAPILVITGTIGQIMGVMPIVVIAVIIASLAECFYILPGHLAHAFSNRDRRVRWSYWRQLTFSLLAAFTIVLIGGRTTGTQSLFGLGSFVAVLDSWRDRLPEHAFTVAIAGLSLVVGTVIEALIYALRRWSAGKGEQNPSAKPKTRAFDRVFNRFRDGPFRWLVTLSYNWRYITVALAVALVLVFVVGLIRSDRVGFVFFPSPEAENIRGYVTMNAGTPEDQVIEAVRIYEEALRQAEERVGGGEPLVEAVFSMIGRSGRSQADNLAEIRVQLTSSEVRSVRTREIVSAWREAVPKIPGVRRFAIIEARGGPPGRDIDVQLKGASAGVLKAAASEVAEVLSGIAGISGVDDDLPYGKPELIMRLTPRGSALGFSIEEVGRQVRNAVEGAIALRFADGDDEVTIRVTQKLREPGVAGVRNLQVRSPSGDYVPLSEIVTLTESRGFATIQRRDGKSKLSVSGDIDSEINTTDGVIEELEERGILDQIAAKHGVEYEFGGRAEEQREAFADLGVGTAVALSVIYVILAWVFGSYWRPVAVMLIIPFGVVGAVVGHWLLGFQLTILSLIGLLGLAGILVNNSIILVARLDERVALGEELATAVIGASQDRLRAVLLTSITTIGGLLPLMFEKSLQAQFLLPMAITIVFGLASATLLVLFLVPALVGIGDDIRKALSAVFGSGGGPRLQRPWSAAPEPGE